MVGVMLKAAIRPVETRTVETTGVTLEDVAAELEAACGPGWEVADQQKGLLRRVDGIREIEGADLDAIRAQAGTGWQILWVATA